MLTRIIAVGKLKEKYLEKGVAEYAKRLQAYTQLQMLEIADQSIPKRASLAQEAKIMAREGEGILKLLPPSNTRTVVVLDRQGQPLTSEGLALWLEKQMLQGKSEVSWVIGGTLGLTRQVCQKADLCLSFSTFTFPHPLMRLILLEQIYRCFRILRRETYHR